MKTFIDKNLIKIAIGIIVLGILTLLFSGCVKKKNEDVNPSSVKTDSCNTNCQNPNNYCHCVSFDEYWKNQNVKYGYSIKSVSIGQTDTATIFNNTTINKASLIGNQLYDYNGYSQYLSFDTTTHSDMQYYIGFQYNNNSYLQGNLNKNIWVNNNTLVNITYWHINNSSTYTNVSNVNYRYISVIDSITYNYNGTENGYVSKGKDILTGSLQDYVHLIFEYDDLGDNKHYVYDIYTLITRPVL